MIFLSGMIYLTSYNIIHIEVIDRLSIPIHIDTSVLTIDANIINPTTISNIRNQVSISTNDATNIIIKNVIEEV